MRQQQDRNPSRVRNEAVALYEMNADEVFDTDRHMVIDSSLGLILGSPREGGAGRLHTQAH